jgi:D-alanyl-D-alanine carboxypeptidase
MQQRAKTNPFLVKGSQYKGCSEVLAFIAEMNKFCCRLGLKASMFDSPHGLMNQFSKSTAFDIAKLSAVCLQDKRFK